MKKQRLKLTLILSLSLLFTVLKAEVKLPHIFGSNMVLQANQPITVWGWASPKEKIQITFCGENVQTKADKSGKWQVQLKPQSYGGPYTMEIKATKNRITLQDILMGEVWICSGQSNMEFHTREGNNAAMESANANYPEIRFFTIGRAMKTSPQSDCQGSWLICSPQTAGDFSAVGYFFGRELFKQLNVPIGLIHTSWGGTDIETWISPQSITSLPAHYKERYQNLNVTDLDVFITENENKRNAFNQAMKEDKDLKEKWYENSFDISSWEKATVPSPWSRNELGDFDGIAWFSYDFTLPDDCIGKSGEVSLGPIDDEDITWINGTKIGQTNGYAKKRIYTIPTGVLSKHNRLTIRVTDYSGEGGINGLQDELYLKIGNQTMPFNQEQWKHKIAVDSRKFNYQPVGPNMLPSLLYNAMVNPIAPLRIQGVIWYQGENNASRAYDYRTLFPTLINDWRQKWGYEFPFYWVQLANYMAKDPIPQASEWAELREAQNQTLFMPSTGQAVIADIGEAADIHPKNKQDVGARLARIALNRTYGKKDIIYSGPTFRNMEIQGNKAVLSFDNTAGGLETPSKYGYIEGFTIAGPDQKFKWAKAYLKDNKVIVYNEDISTPVAVRYAWSNNPDINLYNKAGLPAVPFRTDNWKGITQK